MGGISPDGGKPGGELTPNKRRDPFLNLILFIFVHPKSATAIMSRRILTPGRTEASVTMLLFILRQAMLFSRDLLSFVTLFHSLGKCSSSLCVDEH